MKCIRLSVVFLISLALASPAIADVTLKQKSSGKGMGAVASGDSTQYVKGLKIRNDQTIGGNQTTTIIDAQTKQMFVVNHAKKEVEVYEMQKMAEGLSKINVSEIKTTVTPTGQTRQIAGSTCSVHDVSVSVPMQMGNQTMTFVMSGPYCLVKNVQGAADYAAFYRYVAENGLFFSDPRQAKGMPAQAKGMAEMYRKIAELGVPFSSEMNISFEGGGPMGAMMSKMGSTSILTEVTSLSTEALADSLFEVPAGYKMNKR
jgi:hypothetical protein